MNTKFCHVGSLGSYSYLAEYSDMLFFLAPIAEYNSEYYKYFSKKSKNKKYTILDSGALELSIGTEQVDLNDKHFLEMALDLQVNELICPDEPLNPKSSLLRTLSFLNLFKTINTYQDTNIMFVPHGADLKEWFNNFETIHKEIPNGTVGIPRLLSEKCNSFEPNFRVNVSKILRNKYPRVKIHFLGAGTNFLSELEAIKSSGDLVRSIDSTFLHRHALTNQDPKAFYAPPVNLKSKFLSKNYHNNINRLQKLFMRNNDEK